MTDILKVLHCFYNKNRTIKKRVKQLKNFYSNNPNGNDLIALLNIGLS